MIFVFGSNEAGRHGRGAARDALLQHGAKYGVGVGHVGNSYAIPTKDNFMNVLPIMNIRRYVNAFIDYAEQNPKMVFQVTRVGTGLANIPEDVMASMFMHAPSNCKFDEKWKKYLPPSAKFWGTF